MKATMSDKLLHLLKQRYITPLDALKHAGCLSLSQRCGEYRRRGLKVQDKWVELGGGKRCKAYRLAAK
jgi:hypothetical protein